MMGSGTKPSPQSRDSPRCGYGQSFLENGSLGFKSFASSIANAACNISRIYYFAPGRYVCSIAISVSVCLSVCLHVCLYIRSDISKHTSKLHEIFYTCYL